MTWLVFLNLGFNNSCRGGGGLHVCFVPIILLTSAAWLKPRFVLLRGAANMQWSNLASRGHYCAAVPPLNFTSIPVFLVNSNITTTAVTLQATLRQVRVRVINQIRNMASIADLVLFFKRCTLTHNICAMSALYFFVLWMNNCFTQSKSEVSLGTVL